MFVSIFGPQLRAGSVIQRKIMARRQQWLELTLEMDLVYCGDVNGEDASVKIILSLCGFLRGDCDNSHI